MREKDRCSEIQNTFQRDLVRIKYKVADNYVKLLRIGNTPQNYSSSSTLNLSANLQGLGPKFKLDITLDNVGNEPLFSCEIVVSYDFKIFNYLIFKDIIFIRK